MLGEFVARWRTPVRLQRSCQDLPQALVSIASASTPATAVTKHGNTPTPESRIPLPRVGAPPTPRLANSTHKISEHLPGQSSSAPADAFFYTLDRIDNEKN